MTAAALRHRRRMSLSWGALAIVCLAGAAVVWHTSDAAAEHAILGPTGVVGLTALAIAVTLAAILAGSWPVGTSAALRWGLALPVAVVAGVVAVEALRAVFAPQSSTDVALGLLLMAAVVGMNVVATQLARRVSPRRTPH